MDGTRMVTWTSGILEDIFVPRPLFRGFLSNLLLKMKVKSRKRPSNKIAEEKDEIEQLKIQVAEYDWSRFERFEDIPISRHTKRGLAKNDYRIPTDIQKQSIGYILCGNDLLGAAKTGSGKTLAFLIPMLECLYKNRWTSFDGVGAIIISPTRELSYQIFEVLKKIGAFHDFSAGLIIGGKDLKFESKRMDRCNIIVCTPGRLLQHMDENPLFNCDNLKMLILDEADRILDLGFAKTMNAIINNLPQSRQTVLFSATQTKSIKDLAKLSLQNPIYVSSHEHEKYATPDNLTQSYIVCELQEKINILWSFIKQHTKHKIIVFLSTCKQAKFIYELFCHLRPGIPLLALYGTLHQMKRMSIYDKFCESSRVVLFATDIAARGLDFPSVDWVVQSDCPEDINTYIHRVGRTARFEKNGESLLMLLPSEEESMIKQLKAKKVPIEKIMVDPRKCFSIQRKAEALLAKHVSLKESAQRAFKAYLKNVFLMADKTVFRFDCLDVDSFAKSLGLLIAPRIRFIERKMNTKKNMGKIEQQTEHQALSSSKTDNKTHDLSLEDSDSDLDGLFQVKQYRFQDDDDGSNAVQNSNEIPKSRKSLSKAAIAKRLLKKNIQLNTKIKFDETGEVIPETIPTKQTSKLVKEMEQVESGIDIELAKKIMKDEDLIDKKIYRNYVKEKHLTKKLKKKELKMKKSNPVPESEESYGEQSDEFDDDETTQLYIDALPDPDRIYNNQDNETNDDDENVKVNESSFGFNQLKRSGSSSSVLNSNTNKKSKQTHDIQTNDLEFCEKMAQNLLNI